VLGRWLIGGAVLATVIAGAVLEAQTRRPLAPLPNEGLRVAPFFDGWYQNPDGTITLSFGYSNLNQEQVIEIPLGPDNVITPKEYDGRQPTSFPPVIAEAASGGGGAGPRRERERGVFTVTVPSAATADVVWTLTYQGQTFSVPGRAKTGAYQLRWPMAMGSIPPLLRFRPDGPAGRGPTGIEAEPLRTSIGRPLSLPVWVADDSMREPEPITVATKGAAKVAMTVTWRKHSGPGAVVFTPPKQQIAELTGTATSAATFAQPGEYVVRVRADNFGRVDTSPGNQCCWTNGYVKVMVTP
jgi:hypothetical protein